MPCDLGYRSVSETRIRAPSVETVESRTRAQKIDAELLERLGQEDPTFFAWIEELDIGPLLEKALERALAALGPSSLDLRIQDGVLVSRAKVQGSAEKAEATRSIERVARRWQLEILRVVAEILDFEMSLSVAREDGRDVLVLEGEKASDAGVKEYLRIVVDPSFGAELRFEHYKSMDELAADEDRFLALAARLGVEIAVEKRSRSGQDIPKGAVHPHRHKGKGKA